MARTLADPRRCCPSCPLRVTLPVLGVTIRAGFARIGTQLRKGCAVRSCQRPGQVNWCPPMSPDELVRLLFLALMVGASLGTVASLAT